MAEPLVTETQLSQMATGQALMIYDRHKLIAQIPYYGELFDLSEWSEPDPYPALSTKPVSVYKLPNPLANRRSNFGIPDYLNM